MAFENSTLLDDFNRANSADLGASWGNNWCSGYPSFAILSNSASRGTSFDTNYWLGFHTESQECYVTLAALPNAGGLRLSARIQGEGTPATSSAYFVEVDSIGQAFLQKRIAAVDTMLATVGGAGTFAAGEKMGLSVYGHTLEVWRFRSSAWSLLTSLTDSSITGIGYVGLWGEGITTSVTLDDFSGGAIISSVAWIKA
jgi:hypothetical protein